MQQGVQQLQDTGHPPVPVPQCGTGLHSPCNQPKAHY